MSNVQEDHYNMELISKIIGHNSPISEGPMLRASA